MVLTDMMDRLPFPQKRADHRVQMFQFGFGDCETGAGFRLGEFIFFLRGESMVKSFLESAVPFLFATVADIGRLPQFGTGIGEIRNTGFCAFARTSRVCLKQKSIWGRRNAESTHASH